SMEGAIGQAKDAILQIIECLIHGGILSESDITCFIYNSECNAVKFSENPNMLLTNGEIKKFFANVNAGGGTSFASVFAKIIKNLSQINNDLAIIFFTDGVDDSTLNEELKNNLKGGLSNIPYGTEVHSIGFTENHNASLLSWLAQCGRKAGNFLYVKTPDELKSKIEDTTCKLLKLRKKALYVKIGEEQELMYFDDNGIGTLNINCEKKDQKIVISKDQKSLPETAYEFTSLHIMSDSDPMAIQLIIQFIQEKTIMLMNEIFICDAGARHKKCQQTLAVIDLYDKRLDEISNNKSNNFENTKELINMFKDFLTKEKFSNDKIAEFNDFAYGIASSIKLKSSVDVCESKSIFIPYEDGIWNGQEIYNGSYSKIEFGTYKNCSKRVAVKHFVGKVNLNKIVCELRKHRNLRNADIKNVITFYGVVRKPDYKICLVMEYAEYGNLQYYLSKTQYQWEQKAEWAIDISRGVIACHEYGITHLNMKTKNIFVDYASTLKIADFGLSYMRPRLNIECTEKGSIPWTSPEYISDDPKLRRYYEDQPQLSDIYSYGLVVWEILMNGKRPYDNMDNDEIIEAKLSKKIDNLIEELKGRNSPDELSNIVQKCCVYNPLNRIALEE
ncbi:44975_t:CDS:2, partial [Gigaspora margarita]